MMDDPMQNDTAMPAGGDEGSTNDDTSMPAGGGEETTPEGGEEKAM